MTLRWYVIHTSTGFENKVKISLEQRLKELGFTEQVPQIVIPTENVVEIRRGKKQITARKFLPGYVLVQMEKTPELLSTIKNQPRVTGFLGGNEPTPLKEDEIKAILKQIEDASEKPKPKVVFSKGEKVQITDGPFTNFQGIVDDVNEEKAIVKVLVSIFGRMTPVELEFLQVDKL